MSNRKSDFQSQDLRRSSQTRNTGAINEEFSGMERSSMLLRNVQANPSPQSPAMMQKENEANTILNISGEMKRTSEIKEEALPHLELSSNRTNLPYNSKSPDERPLVDVHFLDEDDEMEFKPSVAKIKIFMKEDTIFNDLGDQKMIKRFREILERAAKTDERFKGLNRFFARKKIFEALHSRKQPLEQIQLLMLGDNANPANNILSDQYQYNGNKTFLRKRSTLKDYKKSSTKSKTMSIIARVKLISMLKLAKKGELKSNPIFRCCHFVKEWVILVIEVYGQPLHPEGWFKIVWDLLTLILIFWEMLVTPLGISFPESQTSTITNIQLFVDIYFIADIFVSFQTGVYSKGNLYLQRKKIANKYLKGWFWVDLPASFPYSWVIPDSGESNFSQLNYVGVLRFWRLLKILRLLRILKLSRMFSRIESFLDLSLGLNTFLSLLKLSGLILMIAHWIACIWHLLAVLETNSPVTWLIQANLQDDSWSVQYISSIYWAVTTMITVGYGDIVPVTPNEKILATCVIIIASGVFAFTMNSINVILLQMNHSKTDYQNTMISLNSYLKQKHISRGLKGKVKNFLTYNLKYYSQIRAVEERIMSLLSEQLRNEMIIEINGRILNSSSVFSHLFSHRMMWHITLIMNQLICSPDEIILREDTMDDCSIYFVDKGNVKIYNYFSEAPYSILKKSGDVFGEVALFTEQQRTASVRAIDFSGLFSFKRDDFLFYLREHPKDLQRFCMIKDQILLLGDYSGLKIECFSCKSSKHTVVKCPELHYGVQKQKVIEKYISNIRIFNRKVERRVRKNQKQPLKYIQRAVQNFQMKNRDLLEFEYMAAQSKDNLSDYQRANTAHSPVNRTNTIPTRHQQLEDFAEQFSIMKKRVRSRAPDELEQRIQEQARMDQMGQTDYIKEDHGSMINNPTLDRIKNFEIYFPHNNFTKILATHLKSHSGNARASLSRRRNKDAGRDSEIRKTFFGKLKDKITTFISPGNNRSKTHNELVIPRMPANNLKLSENWQQEQSSNELLVPKKQAPSLYMIPTPQSAEYKKSEDFSPLYNNSFGRNTATNRQRKASDRQIGTRLLKARQSLIQEEEQKDDSREDGERSPDFHAKDLKLGSHRRKASANLSFQIQNEIIENSADLKLHLSDIDNTEELAVQESHNNVVQLPLPNRIATKISMKSAKSEMSHNNQKEIQNNLDPDNLNPEEVMDYLIEKFGAEKMGLILDSKSKYKQNG